MFFRPSLAIHGRGSQCVHGLLPSTHANMLTEKVWVAAQHSIVTYNSVSSSHESLHYGYQPTEDEYVRSHNCSRVLLFSLFTDTRRNTTRVSGGQPKDALLMSICVFTCNKKLVCVHTSEEERVRKCY